MKKPSYFNSEGYPSPTEYYAELHIMQEERAKRKALAKFRPLVYISVLRFREMSRRISERRGCIPGLP